MATHRPEIGKATKERLRAEAGQKCSNPGCPNRRTHLHHIREWAAYQSHDDKHMIAVCPSCHDAIHHGEILLSDNLLYEWKSICRRPGEIRSHIFVEPGNEPKLMLGSFAVTSSKLITIFELSPFNILKFCIKNDNILLLESSITTLSGNNILKVVDNHIQHNQRADVGFLQIPGTVSVQVPASEEFIPIWALNQMRVCEADFGVSETLTALRLSVLKPGIVRIQGVWAQMDKVIVITEQRICFILPDKNQPLSIVGHGEESVIIIGTSGNINPTIFGFS